MSSLQSIYGFNLDSDLVQKFLKDYTILAKNGKNIILCWIPLWGCCKTDVRGKLVEDILLKHNLSLLNDVSYTIHTYTLLLVHYLQ